MLQTIWSRRHAAGCVVIAAGFLLCGGRVSAQQPAAAPPVDSTRAWAHVTYISGPTVYLDAGQVAGLRQGAHLQVVRDTAFVAELAVQYISSTSAACTVVRSGTLAVAVGDSAAFTPAASPVAAATPTATIAARASSRAPAWRETNRLRGRIGVRYLTSDAGIGPAGVMSQPAFDVRLDGTHLSDSPFGLSVDVRAQRSILAPPDSTHPAPTYPLNVTRVYKAAVQWNPTGTPTTITIGRQFSVTSSSVGLFDGIALDYTERHWSAGAFGGLQPSLLTFGLSDSTREYGAYVQWHNAAMAMPIWSFTVGGVGAYTMGQIDREFTYATAMVVTSRLSAYVTQELDINRGWRAMQEHSAATPTSTFATVQLSLTDVLSLNGGVDNRRNVLLYQDYVNPETIFDNSFRQGIWGGASLNLHGRFRLSGDARTTSGGPAGNARSYTGSMGVMRLTPLELGFQARATHYSGALSSGDLQSLSAELSPFDLFHVEATGGLQTSKPTILGSGIGPSRLTWSSLDADWAIGRSIYLMFSIYRELGSGMRNSQNFLSISYRF
ncbi:MAG: hypothetical protein WBQ26_13245 [Gemmatimonadaceae bacterium]